MTQKAFQVSGMVCPHCEARLKTVLEGLNGVESAVTSHKDGTAQVIYREGAIGEEAIAAAIEECGFEVGR